MTEDILLKAVVASCRRADEVSRSASSTPVAGYGRESQERAADELVLLPDGSAVADMLSDYAVLRDQARNCAAGDD